MLSSIPHMATMSSSPTPMAMTISTAGLAANKRVASLTLICYTKAQVALVGHGAASVSASWLPLGASGRHVAVETADGDDDAANDEAQVEAAVDLNLDPKLMPKHVAMIVDGHARWSKGRGLPTEQGHRISFGNLANLISSASSKFQIKVLTVYALSTENLNRPKKEVDWLFSIIEDFIKTDVMELIQRNGLQFNVIGERSRMPSSLQATISGAEELSRRGNKKGMHFVLGISYGGRLEITEACKKIASKVKDGVLRAEEINDKVVEQHLMTNCIIDDDDEEFSSSSPDLLIRHGGEVRLSNFLLWQLAYSELYFSKKMSPEFEEADFVDALVYFQGRNRRFGVRSSSSNNNPQQLPNNNN